MISREELQRLADFECRHPNEMPISFYFKPGTPATNLIAEKS